MAAGQAVNVFVDPSKLTLLSATATNATTVATVTANNHGYANSDTIKVQGADQPEYNGNFVVTNVTANTFDYTMSADPGGAATGTLKCAKLNLAGDDGTTDALAYADLQYAVDNSTMSTGLQINLKSGSTNVLTKTFTGKSGSGVRDPFIVKGYDSQPDDGGIGVIDLGGQYGISPSYAHNLFMNLKVGNTSGTAFPMTNNSDYTVIAGCEIHDALNGYSGSQSAAGGIFTGNYVHDITNVGASSGGNMSTMITRNFFKNGDTKKFTTAVTTGNAGGHMVCDNLVYVDGSTAGMWFTNGSGTNRSFVSGNSIFADGSTATGLIIASGNNGAGSYGINNIVEGFAVGISCGALSSNEYGGLINNTVSNCTTPYDAQSLSVFDGNETKTSSLFQGGALPSSDVFASDNALFWESVYAWFTPVKSNVGAAYNAPVVDRGASQAEGEASYSLHPLAYN